MLGVSGRLEWGFGGSPSVVGPQAARAAPHAARSKRHAEVAGCCGQSVSRPLSASHALEAASESMEQLKELMAQSVRDKHVHAPPAHKGEKAAPCGAQLLHATTTPQGDSDSEG